jgi:hypothetical protein
MTKLKTKQQRGKNDRQTKTRNANLNNWLAYIKASLAYG